MSAQVELREAGGKITLTAYPSVTEREYEMAGYVEVVRAGAFRRTLGQQPPPDVVLNIEHSGLALASTLPVDGRPTLSLSEDTTGLRAVAELSPDDPDAKTLKAKAAQAPLEASFAFRVTDQSWSEEYDFREIKAVELHRGDISIVGRAASEHTQGLVDVRGRGNREERRRRAELIGQRFAGGGNSRDQLMRFGATYDIERARDEALVARARIHVGRAPARRSVDDSSLADIARARAHLYGGGRRGK